MTPTPPNGVSLRVMDTDGDEIFGMEEAKDRRSLGS